MISGKLDLNFQFCYIISQNTRIEWEMFIIQIYKSLDQFVLFSVLLKLGLFWSQVRETCLSVRILLVGNYPTKVTIKEISWLPHPSVYPIRDLTCSLHWLCSRLCLLCLQAGFPRGSNMWAAVQVSRLHFSAIRMRERISFKLLDAHQLAMLMCQGSPPALVAFGVSCAECLVPNGKEGTHLRSSQW